MIVDLPEDKPNTPKKAPSDKWKEDHKIFLTDLEIEAINRQVEKDEKNASISNPNVVIL